MVQVLFSVSAFVEPGTKVAVVGSSPGLGAWQLENAIPLYPQSRIYSSVIPTSFMNWVEVPEVDVISSKELELRGREPVAYKFIKVEGQSTDPKITSAEAIARSTIKFIAKKERTMFKPVAPSFVLNRKYVYDWNLAGWPNKENVVWEGNGSQDNRYLVSTKMGRGNEIEIENLEVFLKRPVDDRDNPTTPLVDGWIYLPTADFIEANGVSEYTQTTRYYLTVKDLRQIHFTKVVDNVYVGSCPRRLSHLEMLRDNLNVGCVFNFQAVEDLSSNWINDTDPVDSRTAAALAELYASENISLVHLPTVDMSTPARSALMAQSAALMINYLYSNPEKAIYIHCNAGVGRAIAGTISLLHFVLGMPDGEAVAYLKQRRPMAYPDLIATRAGLRDFDAKYSSSTRCLLKNW